MSANSAREQAEAWGIKLRTSIFAPVLVFAVEGFAPILDLGGIAFAGMRFLFSPWLEEETLETVENVLSDADVRASFLSSLCEAESDK